MDKIICIGKNYLEHAKELGDAVPENPVVFLKPPSIALHVKNMGDFLAVKLPQGRGQVHYECELILRLRAGGVIEAVSLGLDLTLRDLQTEMKRKGLPWEAAKVFSGSAILGPFIPVQEFEGFLTQSFQFLLDGREVQKARGHEMRFSPEHCIQYVKSLFPICEGDVLFTGTPAGVGPLISGQRGDLHWGDRLHYALKFE